MKRIICWVFGCDDKVISVTDDPLMGIVLNDAQVTTYECKRCGRISSIGSGSFSMTVKID